MRNKYFYPIFKLKAKSWIRYWLLKKTEFKGKLSEILEGFSFNLQNTLRQKFVKFEIEGNSIQDGEPSPENEVPIKSAGENGSITEKIVNKNLTSRILNETNSNLVYIDRFLKIQKGQRYYVALAGDGTFGNVKSNNLFFRYQTETNDNVYGWKEGTNFENGKYIDAEYDGYLGIRVGGFNTYTNLIISKSIITAYVPHEEQTYSIYTQQPFRSIGDVRDVFFKNTKDSEYYDENLVENGWYERHAIPRKIFTGEENFVSYSTSVSGHYRYMLAVENIKKPSTTGELPDILSTHYKRQIMGSAGSWGAHQGISIDVGANNIVINDDTYYAQDTTDYKTWLATKYASGNPVYVYYVTTNPLNLLCTTEQTNILENIPSTFSGQTNVFSEDEVKAYLKIQYWESDTNG